MSATLRIPHVLDLSFRANAEDEQKELPPPSEVQLIALG
jgi:hypothetical protein